MPTQPNSLQRAVSACLSARISSLPSFSFLPVSVSLSLTARLLLFLSSYIYKYILNVQESSCSSKSYQHQLTEATSLTIVSNQTPDGTNHYSGYVNTEESPKEESQFSCRHHPQVSHFSFCSKLTELRQAASDEPAGL